MDLSWFVMILDFGIDLVEVVVVLIDGMDLVVFGLGGCWVMWVWVWVVVVCVC